MLQCSAIPHAEGAQSFFDGTILSHFSLLQYSVVFHCYSTHSFLVTTVREAAQSFCKMTELGRGRAWVGGGARLDRGRLVARSRVRWTEQRVARVGCALARSVGPLVGSR
jgi:hypothetical protein